MIEFDNLYYTYPGAQGHALSGATCSIAQGERVALIGRNGCGKSTLLLHGNGILQPERGEVRVAGRRLDYRRAGLLDARRRVGIVFQNPDDQLFSASVAQDISFGPLNLGLNAAEARRRVDAAAELCEISDLLERPTHSLSGGQKTRVALAGVLAMEPDIVLVDEALAALDPWMRRQALAIFERLVAQGTTVVLSTHDLALARIWADRLVVMQAGQVLAVDTPHHIFADPTLCQVIGPPEGWSAG